MRNRSACLKSQPSEAEARAMQRSAVVVVAGDWCQGSTHDAGERSSCLLAALRADMRFDVKLLNAAAVVDVGDDGGCD